MSLLNKIWKTILQTKLPFYFNSSGIKYSHPLAASNDFTQLLSKKTNRNKLSEKNIDTVYSKNTKLKRLISVYKQHIETELLYDKIASSVKISEVTISGDGRVAFVKWLGMGDKIVDQQINSYLSNMKEPIRRRIQAEERKYNVLPLVFICDNKTAHGKEVDSLLEVIDQSDKLELKSNLPNNAYGLQRDEILLQIKARMKKKKNSVDNAEFSAQDRLAQWRPMLSDKQRAIKDRKQRTGLKPSEVFKNSDCLEDF